jgi:hypothetical protein
VNEPEPLDFEIESLLARPILAHLATASTSGACHSPLWFLWEDGAVWLVGNSRDSFPERISAEPRCAIGFTEFDLANGLLRHLGMRGRGEVVALQEERLFRLLGKYLGHDRTSWNARFVEDIVARLDLMVRFVPERVVARDHSYFK